METALLDNYRLLASRWRCCRLCHPASHEKSRRGGIF
jgi:hypothetical protein